MLAVWVQTESPPQTLSSPQADRNPRQKRQAWYVDWFESVLQVTSPSRVGDASCGRLTLPDSTSMCSHKTTKFWPRQSALGSTRALQVTSGSCYLGVKKSSEVVKVGAACIMLRSWWTDFHLSTIFWRFLLFLKRLTLPINLYAKKEVHSTLSAKGKKELKRGLRESFPWQY